MNKEYAELSPLVEVIKQYKSDKVEINELSKLLEDEDASIKEMAEVRVKR